METPEANNGKREEMNSSVEIMNKVAKEGYIEQFSVTAQGLHAPSRDKHYKPTEVVVVNFYRFEGESDPGDNTILYVIETNDGVKGTLYDAYGSYADKAVAEFMTQVEDITKKNYFTHQKH
jgi:hypothetical protein